MDKTELMYNEQIQPSTLGTRLAGPDWLVKKNISKRKTGFFQTSATVNNNVNKLHFNEWNGSEINPAQCSFLLHAVTYIFSEILSIKILSIKKFHTSIRYPYHPVYTVVTTLQFTVDFIFQKILSSLWNKQLLYELVSSYLVSNRLTWTKNTKSPQKCQKFSLPKKITWDDGQTELNHLQ
jgi:hypothetical protein